MLRQPVNDPQLLVRNLVPVYKRCFASAASKKSSQTNDSERKTSGRMPKKYAIQKKGQNWLNKEGNRFDNMEARNWLHPERPFPKNPWFVPPSPVGDLVRKQIYDDYASDPVVHSPRKLAEKYNLSVIRVEAILRLKHLEKVQENQGYVLQKSYAREMERLLAVGKEPIVKETHDSQLLETITILPAFKVTDADEPDENEIRQGQAQKEEEKRGEITAERFIRRADGNYILALSGLIEEPEPEPEIMQDDPKEKSKFDFIIADLSKEKKCLVREKTGVLRTATKAETRLHEKLFPMRRIDSSKGQSRELWYI